RLPADVPVTVMGDGTSFAARYPIVATARAIRSQRPDVVLSTLRMNLTVGFARPLLPRTTKLVVRQANDFTTDFAQLVRRSRVKHRIARRAVLTAVSRADAVVCQSESMRRDLQQFVTQPDRLH